MMLLSTAAPAASLQAATSQAWEEYVESAKLRMEQRLSPANSFLWVDEVPDRLARVRRGDVVVSPVGAKNPKKVASGLIHDWIGAVFIPHVTANDVALVLRDYARYKKFYPETVIDAKAIATSETHDRFSILMTNRSFLLKTVFHADYESCRVRVDGGRRYSVSHTTRIQEIEGFGGPGQRALEVGKGTGVLWRLCSITRYAERDEGVYLEIEAIALSRDIPASLLWVLESIVRRESRNALVNSLQQTEKAVLSEWLRRSQCGAQTHCFATEK
jgi:hypothetical protein